MWVIAFDPGVTTGWVSYDTVNKKISAGECIDLRGIYDVLSAEAHGSAQRVLIEDFHLYPSKSYAQSWSRFPAVEVIGAVKMWCAENFVHWSIIPPSFKKSVSNEWLKSLGFWEPTRGLPHARDAAKILVAFLAAENAFMKEDYAHRESLGRI